jgi:hypothetical protein
LERGFEELRGGAVPSRARLSRRAIASFFGSALAALGLATATAHADLGDDLQRLARSYVAQARSEALRPRLLERGELTPIVLPPWALDSKRGNCITLALLAPPATQFVLHLHPWPGSPSLVSSSAGAVQVTRCGKDRLALLQVRVEMRSPRALIHTLLSVGNVPPPELTATLPERDTGPGSPSVSPGPAPEREKLAVRLERFTNGALGSGAQSSESLRVASSGQAAVTLAPGCHRLLASGEAPSAPATLVLSEAEGQEPLRLEPDDTGDARGEVCTLRTRRFRAGLDAGERDLEKTLVVAHYEPPSGLPERFGPELAERLLQALGGSRAPRRLGTLAYASLGAQGLTPLPQQLLPGTCYVAAVVTVHGSAQTLSLGVRAGAKNAEGNVSGNEPGTHVGFCTGKSGRAELEIEARGLGVAWLVTLFQMGPARAEGP